MSSTRKNTFFILFLLAAILFYTFSGGSVGIGLDFGEDMLTISAQSYDHTIAYDEIRSLELSSLTDPGTMIEGADKRSLRYGIWENETWGEYMQCVTLKAERCIIITLNDGQVFILNYENDESTESLHQMFSDLLHSKGYLK